jgi:HNH endonuclease
VQEKKEKQLGLPIGTASHRLRKAVLFRLVQETGRDSCLRCKNKIESVEELVIDHKEAWLDVSVELFWNLDNIGFSHARCNSLSRRSIAGRILGPNRNRKVGQEGTAWCSGHSAFLPEDEFNRNRTKWNGLQSECKVCRSTLGKHRSL